MNRVFIKTFRHLLVLAAMVAMLLPLLMLALPPSEAHAVVATEERLTAPFVKGQDGATSVNSYTGYVTISVWNYGQAAGTNYSDAFYIFTDNAGNPISPEHHDDFGLCINHQPASHYMAILPYNSGHNYMFTLVFHGEHITLGVCDGYTIDNSGEYYIDLQSV
jgi:hypothetical protein